MIRNRALIAWCLIGVLGAGMAGAAAPTPEEAMQRLRERCARHNQIPATDMRSCIDCPFGQHADRVTGQCVERVSAKPMTEEQALQQLRERCARHDQISATDGKSCIACAFGQHADAATGQCVDAARSRSKR